MTPLMVRSSNRRRCDLRRALMTALTAVLVVGIAAAGPPASSRQRDDDWRERTCRYQNLDPGTWTAREEHRTALCVLERWPVPGGWETFSSVIECESHWWRLANNAGNYLGLAQHSAAYWPDRVSSLMPEGWRIGPWTRWTNSRSQLVVTARMAQGGWSAWEGCR